VHQRHLTAQTIAIGVDVGGDANTLARPERIGERFSSGDLLGGRRQRNYKN